MAPFWSQNPSKIHEISDINIDAEKVMKIYENPWNGTTFRFEWFLEYRSALVCLGQRVPKNDRKWKPKGVHNSLNGVLKAPRISKRTEMEAKVCPK